MLLAAMMAFSFSAVTVSAEEKPISHEVSNSISEENSENYFYFIENGKERIDSAGNFVFNITTGINSTRFYVTNSTVQIQLTATADIDGQDYL